MRDEHRHSSTESLFICAKSANPHSVLVLDPFSGSGRWSLRGSELQQGIIQTAEPIGSNPSFLCVTLADKPNLHIIPLVRFSKKGSMPYHLSHGPSVKSTLAQKARFIQAHPCGDFVFVAVGNKVFTWEVHSGQLLSLVEEHLREISAMRISPCGHFLATASLDGDVKVFLTANLISEHERGLSVASPCAVAAYSPHSLSVSDLFLSGGAHSVSALRILSVSADHCAALYSLATKQIILRITADRPLSACCMDPAELRIFLAAESGPIVSLDICAQFSDQFVPFCIQNPSSSSNVPSSIRRFDHQHNASVLKLALSADGKWMSSGDEGGRYCVWDTTNGQCLLSGTLQGPISALSFRRHWPTSEESNGNNQLAPLTSLQRSLAVKRSLKMVSHWGKEAKGTDVQSAQSSLDELLGPLIKRINSGGRILCSSSNVVASTGAVQMTDIKGLQLMATGRELENVNKNGDDNVEKKSERELQLADQVRCLQRELARVVQLNAELYSYSASMALEDGCVVRSGRGEGTGSQTII